MKKNIFIFSLSFFIVLLFSLPLALAPCPDQENPSFCYDANAPENFDWQNGDYNSLNWDNQESIDYSKIDFTRVPSAYAYKVDVSKALAVGRGREVTSEILEAHLERGTLDAISLENLNKEYLSTAIKNKFGFTLNQLESGATFEGGVLRASYGSFAVAGKEGWAIDVNENGQILIVFPTKVTEEKISAEDTFTITEELDFLTAKGETLKVRQLSFRNGQAYVLVGDEAKIGDYLIPKQQSDVNVYFDVREAKNQEEKYGDYAGRNYMVITETSLDIYSQKGSEVVILPQPGNTLFGMVKRKYERDAMGSIIPDKFTWVADELSSLSISVKNGDSITVTSRELEGKIPLVKHIFQKGSLDIITGRDLIVSVTERQIKISPPPPYPQDKEISLENSAAFELQSVSGGKDLATTVVTSSNRYAVLSNEKKITENAIGLRVSRGLAENQMKTIDDLQAKYPAIQFALRDFDQDITVEKERLKGLIEQFGETGVYAENSRDLIAKNIKQIEIERINEISANMAQIVDEWITKNPSKVEPIKMIKFDGRFNAYHSQDRKTGEDEHFLFGERAFDPATLQDRPIRGNNPLQIIDHEYAHMQDSHLYVQEYSLLRSSGINYEEYVREKLDSLYSDVLYEGYVTLGKDHEFREFILDLRVKLAIYGDLSSSKEGELTPELASEIVEFQKKEFERMYHQSFESLDLNQEEYQQLDPQKIDKAYQLLDLWIRRLNADTAEKRFDKEGIGNIAMVDAVLKEAARVYPPLQKEYRQFVRFVEESTGGLPAYAFRNYAKTKEESFYGIRSIRFLGEDFQEAASTSTEIDRDEARRAINQGKKFVREVTQLNYDTGKISRDEYEYRMGNYCKNNACGKCLAYTLTCEPETAVVNSE